MKTPWNELPAKARKAVLEGSAEQVHVRYKNRYGRTRSYYAEFEGVMPFLHRRLEQTESEQMKERYDGYMRDVPCPACAGCPAAAGDPVGHHRERAVRQEVHRRGLRTVDLRLRRLPEQPHARQPGGGHRRSGAQGGAGTSRLPARRRSRVPVARRARRAPCPAARRSGSGSPPRSVPAWSASSTCSTSRRSVCISATTGVSSRP